MDTTAEVTQIIARNLKLPPEKLTPDTKLADLGAESLEVIEIVFELEEKYDISISLKAGEGTLALKPDPKNPTAPQGEFNTVGDIAQVVQALVDAKKSA